MTRSTTFGVFLLVLLGYLPLALAQFGGGGFFQHGFPFGGHHHHQQQQQQQQDGGRTYKGWSEMDTVTCRAGYVCPGSLACVPTPADCPCPYPEDVKCPLPDDRPRDEGEGPPFVCVRGSCDEVIRYSKPI